MPRKNKTDKPVNCWLPKDEHLRFRELQLGIEKKSGVKPILENLVLDAALIGLAELEKIQ